MTKKVLIYKDDFFSTKKYFIDLIGEGKTKTVSMFSTGFKTKKAAVECVKYWLPEAKIWYMKKTEINITPPRVVRGRSYFESTWIS